MEVGLRLELVVVVVVVVEIEIVEDVEMGIRVLNRFAEFINKKRDPSASLGMS